MCKNADGSGSESETARSAISENLFRVMRAVLFGSDKDSPLVELPISQVRCLRVIGHHEGLKMQDLATRMDVKLPALSQVVDRLVKRGLLERRADPDDRRVVRLHLAPEARQMLDATKQERERRLTAAMAHLDEGAVSKVIEGLRLLAEAGERAQDEKRCSAVAAPNGAMAERTTNAPAGESLGEILDRQESERFRQVVP